MRTDQNDHTLLKYPHCECLTHTHTHTHNYSSSQRYTVAKAYKHTVHVYTRGILMDTSISILFKSEIVMAYCLICLYCIMAVTISWHRREPLPHHRGTHCGHNKCGKIFVNLFFGIVPLLNSDSRDQRRHMATRHARKSPRSTWAVGCCSYISSITMLKTSMFSIKKKCFLQAL